MELSENAEEILERLWTDNANGAGAHVGLRDLELDKDGSTLKELQDEALIDFRDETVSLTPKGLDEARKVVRRHRLAERLLMDVLDTDPGSVEDAACRFEHILRNDVEENVCTLLGHPRICPHGNPIPSGKCCKEDLQRYPSFVFRVGQTQIAVDARIASDIFVLVSG
jgi:DtxR family Mn-dependent transcriptional regulator